MKFNTITLIHNQEKNLDRIFTSYLSQKKQPDYYIFVLDRCTDRSHELILEFAKTNKCEIIVNNEGNGFMAGYCRDLGLSSIKNPGAVLFIDGDCIPNTENVFSEAYNELSKDIPSIVLVSRIFEKENSNEIESYDRRCSIPWVKGRVFVSGKNNEITDKYVSRWRALVISCCFGLNNLIIDEIKKINSEIFNSDRIFPPEFDGSWGGEDEYIGSLAMLFDFRVCAIDPINNVRHIWHHSNENKTYEKTFEIIYNIVLQYATSKNAPGLYNSKIDLNKIIFQIIRR